MKKMIIFFVLSLTISGTIQGQENNCFNFIWQGKTVSGRFIPNMAINVPVTIEDWPYKFKMQFDLGAVQTVFYGNTINPFLEEFPAFRHKIDSTLTFFAQSQENVILNGVDLQFGKVKFEDNKIGIFSNFGDSLSVDSIKSQKVIHIGTIAPDIFQNKILIIDYPKSKICISDNLSDQYTNLNYQDFILENGRVKLPIYIGGNKEWLLFDTGSSIFSLLTSKKNAELISENTIIDSLKVSSWGKYHTALGKQVTSTVTFANKKLTSKRVYYFNTPIFDQFFKQLQIWGITGNSFFLDNKLIIDYKNQKVGLD